MWNLFIAFTMPPLLVFGLYHLMTWVNFRGINERVYWKRVALAAGAAHVLLAVGFFVFSYFDYQMNREFSAFGMSFGDFLFNGPQFWRMLAIFDTAAMAVIIGLFYVLDRLGMELPGAVGVTIVLTLVIGTVQWYFVGGGIGGLLQKVWDGMKTPDDPDFTL